MATAAARVPAASAAARHRVGRSRVVDTGSGGRPYTSARPAAGRTRRRRRRRRRRPPGTAGPRPPRPRAGWPPAARLRAARPARRTGWSRSGRPWRRPAPARRATGRSRGALEGPAVVLAPVDDPERAGGHAVAAAVADVGWTTTVPNSVRNSAPSGQTSRHAAELQCLRTSSSSASAAPGRRAAARRRRRAARCWPRAPVLS